MKRKYDTKRMVSIMRREIERLKSEATLLRVDKQSLEEYVFMQAFPQRNNKSFDYHGGYAPVMYGESMFACIPNDKFFEKHSFNSLCPYTQKGDNGYATVFGFRALFVGGLVILVIPRKHKLTRDIENSFIRDIGFRPMPLLQAFCLIEKVNPEELNT